MRQYPGQVGPYAHKGNQWVGYDDLAAVQDKSVYVNQDWSECLAAMKRAGFEAELGSTQLEGMAAYRPLIGRKKDAVTAGS